MEEFDSTTERCVDCDGHFRHFEGCAQYQGEPVLPLEMRLELQRVLAGVSWS